MANLRLGVVLSLACLAFAGPATACSLALTPDFRDAYLVPGAVYANLGQDLVSFRWDGSEPATITRTLMPGTPRHVVSPDGRYVVHEDQDGISADCSGFRYTLAHDMQTQTVTRWNESLRPLLALPSGFVAANFKLDNPRIVSWGNWNETRSLDWSFLPEEGFVDSYFESAAAMDGSRIAFWGNRPGEGRLYAFDVEANQPLGTPIPAPMYQMRSIAMSRDGARVALLEHSYDNLNGGSLIRLHVTNLDDPQATLEVVWSLSVTRGHSWDGGEVIALPDGWLVGGEDGAYRVPNQGPATQIPLPAGHTVQSVAISDRFVAILTGLGNDKWQAPASGIHLYTLNMVEVLHLKPGPDGWHAPPEVSRPTQILAPDASTPFAGLFLLLLALFGAAGVRTRHK